MKLEKRVKIDCGYNLEFIKKRNTYSSIFEIYRKKWNYNPQNFIVERLPLNIDIELTSRCNGSCVRCPFHSKDGIFKPETCEDMNFKLYKKIIDEGANKGLYAIKLNYRGEPLLYYSIVKAVKYAKDKGIIDVMFNTNGSFLTKKISKDLINAGLDKIMISIDDHREDIFNIMRAGNNFNTIIRNLKDLIKERTLSNTVYPEIRIQRRDFFETREFKADYNTYMSSFADAIEHQTLLDYHNITYNDNVSNWCCAFLWQRLSILVDGTVICCHGMPDKRKILGNVNNTSIEKLWHSEFMDALRAHHKNKETHLLPFCCACPVRTQFMYSSF